MAPGSVMIIGLLMVSTFAVLLNEMMLGVALPTLKPGAITASCNRIQAAKKGDGARIDGGNAYPSCKSAGSTTASPSTLPEAGPITSRHQYRRFCVSSIWCPPGAGNFSL